MTLRDTLSRPPPRLLTPMTLREIAKRYGKRYADQVKTLRHRVSTEPPYSGPIPAVGKGKED